MDPVIFSIFQCSSEERQCCRANNNFLDLDLAFLVQL